MKVFSVSGDLGDSYCTACKLYNIEEPVYLVHFTMHSWTDKIADIYSLLDNVSVVFVEQRDNYNKRIHSNFETGCDEVRLQWEVFPEWDLPEVKCALPENYTVINVRSGRDDQMHRVIPDDKIQELLDKHANVVIIGTHDREYPEGVINLTNKTTIKEAFSIIKGADNFHGYQGLMGFFALSQKIPTTLYYALEYEANAIQIRMQKPWHEYCEGIIRV